MSDTLKDTETDTLVLGQRSNQCYTEGLLFSVKNKKYLVPKVSRVELR